MPETVASPLHDTAASPLAKWMPQDFLEKSVKCEQCIYVTGAYAQELGGQPKRVLIRKDSSSRPSVVGVGSRDGKGDVAYASSSLIQRLGLSISSDEDYLGAEIKQANWLQVGIYNGSAGLTMAIAVIATIAAVGTAVTVFLSSTAGLVVSLIVLALAVLAAIVKGGLAIHGAASIGC